MQTKFCIKCESERDINEFIKTSSYCYPCRRDHNKEWKRLKRLSRPKKPAPTPEQIAEKKRLKRERANNYVRNYRKTNVNYRIAAAVRSRILVALKKGIKNSSSWDLLGCSPEEYSKYLQIRFTPEMSWDNYGSYWEIDHIVPCSHFNLVDGNEQKKAFHYTNTQPLSKTENQFKNNRFVG